MLTLENLAEYEEHYLKKSKNKHIFIEFFSPGCHWCKKFKDEYDDIYDYFMSYYGQEQIQIFKVNGGTPGGMEIVKKYTIPHYPDFIYVKPNNDGAITSKFSNQVRTYETMKKWMLD